MRGALLAFCIALVIVLPAAAAGNGQAARETMAGSIDPGLKDDLWASHQQYRLQLFDTNTAHASDVLEILGKYGVDTTLCQNTLSIISGKRSELESALISKDREKIRTINAELKSLWKQFRSEVREALRAQYGRVGASAAVMAAGPGFSDAPDAAV